MLRPVRYAALVRARKAFDPKPWSLTNPSKVDSGSLDSPHIGPWTIWVHDLNAQLEVVGQDWGDVSYLRKNGGVDKPINPTNNALKELLASIGHPPSSTSNHPGARWSRPRRVRGLADQRTALAEDWSVFRSHRPELVRRTSHPLLREKISIDQTRTIVALGQRADVCICVAYGQPLAATATVRSSLRRTACRLTSEGSRPSSSASIIAVRDSGTRYGRWSSSSLTRCP
jgi:hypothetical protein